MLAVSLNTTGMLVAEVRPTPDDPTGEIVFTNPANRRLIRKYEILLKYGVDEYGIKEYHRRMGRLFGYDEEDIEAFIAADVHCNCIKCSGS